MFKMSVTRLTVDEDVIKEGKDKVSKIRFHNFIRKALEG